MNKKIGLGIVEIIVLIGAFYGGVTYGKNHTGAAADNQFRQTFGQNMMGARGARNGNFGGFMGGEIISKDSNSITIKLQDGGSRIIFLDNNTKVQKSVEGTAEDLVVGTEVSINGTPNADGSINAQSVQIRPNIAQPVVK